MSRCPRCKVPTQRMAYEGVDVRMCGECGGYWVEPMSLKAIANKRHTEWTEAVKERFLELADRSNATEKLVCLSCAKTMVKEQFKEWDDIVIDLCRGCGGIWLDPGELEKIQIYWEYFQDHPEQSNMDALAKKALLTAEVEQRGRDMREAAEVIRHVSRSRFAPRYLVHAALGTLLGR